MGAVEAGGSCEQVLLLSQAVSCNIETYDISE